MDLLHLANNLINSPSKVINIPRVQPRHADTTVLGHVDVEVGPQLGDLGFGQASKAEHADLVCDVVPLAGGSKLLELGAESLAHLDDTARHGAEVLLPLGEQGRIIKNDGGDAGAVDGWVADLGALQDR